MGNETKTVIKAFKGEELAEERNIIFSKDTDKTLGMIEDNDKFLHGLSTQVPFEDVDPYNNPGSTINPNEFKITDKMIKDLENGTN